VRCQFQHLAGSKKGQVEEITAQRISLGRAPDNLIAFDPYIDADCSGHHAALEERDDGFIYVVDLNSSNGTFVNGAPVPPGQPGTVCPPGSMVQLCKAGPALKLDYTPGPSRKAALPPPPPPPPEKGNGMLIGLALGGAALVAVIIVVIVLATRGGDEAAPEGAPHGSTGADGQVGHADATPGASDATVVADADIIDGEGGGGGGGAAAAAPVADADAKAAADLEADAALKGPEAAPAAATEATAPEPVWDEPSRSDDTKLPTGARIALGAPADAEHAPSAAKSVAISKDGRRIAAGFEDGTARVGTLGREKARAAKVAGAPVLAVAFRDDAGAKVAALSAEGTRTWAWESGAPSAAHALPSPMAKVGAKAALQPGGTHGAYTAEGGAIVAFDAEKGGAPRTLAATRHKRVHGLALAPDGRTLGSAGVAMLMRTYNMADSKEDAQIEKIKDLEGEGSAIAFSGDGKIFAFVVGERATVYTVDKVQKTDKGMQRKRFPGITLEVGEPDALALSPDGHLLAVEGARHAILVYDVTTGAKVLTLTGHKARVGALAFGGPGGAFLGSASADKTAILWNVPAAKK